MDDLVYKYKNDSLTEEELIELRKAVNALSDSQLENILQQTWEEKQSLVYKTEDAHIKRIKDSIDHTLKRERRLSLSLRYMQIAAAILLPVFVISFIYLFLENRRLESGEMIVSTGLNERAGITLPDGSRITLNASSQIFYSPKSYNRSERNIRFEGEGYFQVRKNQDIPFIITTSDIQVEVLGTTFNFSIYPTDETAELALEEGSVSLLSFKNQETVILDSNEKAVVNRKTGEITIFRPDNIQVSSAWKRGEMVFRNSCLRDVLQQVGRTYNVKFHVESPIYMESHFTGTLPSTDLNEVLEVLELSLGLKSSIQDKAVLLMKK